MYSLLVKSRVTSKCLLPLGTLPVFVAAIALLNVTFTSTLLLPHLSREAAVSDLPVSTSSDEIFFGGGGYFPCFLKGLWQEPQLWVCKALWNAWVMCDENKPDFYRIAPAMLRQASYGTIKIGTYQTFKRLLVERPEGESQFLYLSLSLSLPDTHTCTHTFWQTVTRPHWHMHIPL